MNNKLKTLMNRIKKIYGEVYDTYKVTMVLVDITTLFTLLFSIISDISAIEMSDSIYRIVEWLQYFFLYWSFGCMAVESFRRRFFEKYGNVKKTVGIVIFALISGLLSTLFLDHFLGIQSNELFSLKSNRLIAINLAYFVLILLSVLYQRYKDSGFALEKYVVHVFTQIIQIGIAWGILAVGFLLLSIAFEALIYYVPGCFMVPQTLIVGLFVAPCFLMAVTRVKEEVGRFFEILIKYVLLIITIVGAGIIYLYIIKTVFTGIPSNEIFAITSTLFFVAIPVGFACTAFERDTTLQKTAYVLPYVYAPFIVLQAYSIIVRIAEYGVTPSRYAGILLIILEIIYTVMYAFFRKHIDKIILVMMAITALATVIPGVNAIDFSRITQKRILTAFVQNGMPDSDEGKRKISGAYLYLLNECGENYIDEIVPKDLANQISDLDEESNNKIMSYNLYTANPVISTDGYKYVAEFSASIDSYDSDKSPSKMKLVINNETIGEIDLSEEYESVIKRCRDSGESTIYGPDIVKISDDCELYIRTAYIVVDSFGDELVGYSVSGYALLNSEPAPESPFS